MSVQNTKIIKSMKFPKILLLILIATSALAGFSGCSTQKATGTYADAYNRTNNVSNLFGLYKYSPGSYEVIPETTAALHTDEILLRKNTSGDNHKLLWGAVTIADY